MRLTTNEGQFFPQLLWIRAIESDTEIAAFAPVSAGIRILGADRATDALSALARDPDRATATVVVESGVSGFESLCERLAAMSPPPRVIVVYPRTRVFHSASRLLDVAAWRQRPIASGE
jgi:hypothetical protein